MRMITGKGRHDCGVCALATACEVSWFEACEAIWPGVKRKSTFGTFARHLVKAARRLGWKSPKLRPTVCRSHKWADVPPRSLVKVIPRVCRDTRNWHWVVWDGKHVLNAQRGKRYRKPPYRPESYISLQPST